MICTFSVRTKLFCANYVLGPTTKKDGGNNIIIIIVCAVLAFLFLCLLIFIIYHYRTSLHKVFKSRANRPIYVRNHYDHQSEDRVLLNSPENHRGFSNTSTPYAKVSYKGDKSGKLLSFCFLANGRCKTFLLFFIVLY